MRLVNIIKNKKGQEEMVGFVLIVVIVAIIFLVFLGIFARQEPGALKKESRDIYQFLESTMEYTSECAISYEPDYSKVGELIRDCNADDSCTNGKKACLVLNDTLSKILENSWQVGPGRAIKGYEFISQYETNITRKTIVNIKDGNCTGELKGSEYLTPAFPGTIISSLNICY